MGYFLLFYRYEGNKTSFKQQMVKAAVKTCWKARINRYQVLHFTRMGADNLLTLPKTISRRKRAVCTGGFGALQNLGYIAPSENGHFYCID